jgi:hypothetical protein
MPANTPTLDANAKWVTDKGSQVFNAKAYGAKCDGVTDDSAAFAAAIAAMPAGGGTLFIPPCATPYNISSARVAVTKSNTLVSGYGATLLCNVSDDCLTIGNPGGSAIGYNNFIVRGLSIEAGVGSPGHSAIRDNSETSLIEDISNVPNPSWTSSAYVFNHFIENDNDQQQTVRHINYGGPSLVCNSTFCGSILWEPGPVSTNAGITYLSDSNLGPMCHGNGIDWLDGNDLHIKGVVLQGYNQFAIRIYAGISKLYNFSEFYTEVGNCSNPLGNVGIAGLISIGAIVSKFGGQGPSGGPPAFPQAGTTGSTYYSYYIVGENASGQKSTPLAAGFVSNGNATINGTNYITVTWNDFEQANPTYTYDVLRSTLSTGTPGPAPYGTGNYAVATGLVESNVCSNGLCTFVDTVATPSSYAVTNYANNYVPTLNLWGASIVLSNGASYYGDSFPQGGNIVSSDTPNTGQATLFGSSTSQYGYPAPFSPMGFQAINAGILYQPRHALMFDTGYAGAGTKGIVNLGAKAGASQDSITLADSNPAKTYSYYSARPPYDAGDAAICRDSGTARGGTCIRDGAAISEYLNSLPDGIHWFERTIPGIKMFNIPLGSLSVIQTAPPYQNISVKDVGTGGTLLPGTQYCYRESTLDYLGETSPSREVCVTTARDGHDTHSIQLIWESVAYQGGEVVRGYNVYGRTTGAEQFMVNVSDITGELRGNGAYVTWTDTGSVTPSGAMPIANTTGQVKPALYSTATNCSSSASPAVCGSAAAGSFVIAAKTTSVVVHTTAVTANSQILLTEDSSLGSKLSVTCNTQSPLVLGAPIVTRRSAGTSFTAAIQVGPTTNPMCVSYTIIN